MDGKKVSSSLQSRTHTASVMSWTEIIFWLFARLRPVLWYAHRLANLLQLALLVS